MPFYTIGHSYNHNEIMTHLPPATIPKSYS